VKAVLQQLDTAAKDMTGAPYTFAEQDLLVSVARDIAQQAIVAGGASAMSATASMTADAEHDVLSGLPEPAVALLTQARSAAVHGATTASTMRAAR
jgi:beta-glucosidase